MLPPPPPNRVDLFGSKLRLPTGLVTADEVGPFEGDGLGVAGAWLLTQPPRCQVRTVSTEAFTHFEMLMVGGD